MIHICIPCRDERETIGVLLWRIREVMLELGRDFRILDDGCRDGTRELLERYSRVLPLTILTQDNPIGYGAALEQLLVAASEGTGYPKRDAAVTMQADFTEHPDTLRRVVRTFEGGADIVACERADASEEGGATPMLARVARWLVGSARGRHTEGDAVADPLIGLRAYRIVVVRKALAQRKRPLATSDRWAANVELMRSLAPHARRVAHVPVALRHDIRRRPTRRRLVATLREVVRARRAVALAAVFAALPLCTAAQSHATPVLDSLSVAPRAVAPLPFDPGERLSYRVKYGIFGVGEAVLGVAEVDTLRGSPVYPVHLNMRANVLGYRFDHWLMSWIDTETLVSRRFVNDQRRRGRYREYDIFPEERMVQRIDRDTTWSIPTSDPLDDISFVYFTRTLPLEVGHTYTFNRFYKEKGNPIHLEILRRDTREVGAGTFNTIVVRPTIPGSSFFAEGGGAEIHLSDDERRLIVYMKVDGPVLPINITMHLEEIGTGYTESEAAVEGLESNPGSDDAQGGGATPEDSQQSDTTSVNPGP